jgi:hypothetical protein
MKDVAVLGLIRQASDQSSAVVKMVLAGSVVGRLVCLLGSIAFGYRRCLGDRHRE